MILYKTHYPTHKAERVHERNQIDFVPVESIYSTLSITAMPKLELILFLLCAAPSNSNLKSSEIIPKIFTIMKINIPAKIVDSTDVS